MKKYTLLHRFLHWTIALTIIILVITAFLRQNWMSGTAISSALQSQDTQLAGNAARKIARAINAPMFQWHIYAGLALAGLFAIRLIYLLAKGIKFPNPFAGGTPPKDKFQGFTYILFYLFVAAQTITGLALKYHLVSRSIERPFKQIHDWGMYAIPIFIILHLAGIYLAERGAQKGITSKMIAGD